MNRTIALRNVALLSALIPLAACSGGGTSVPHTGVLPASGGAASKGGTSHSTVKARLFIPTRSKTFASILRLGKTSSASRRPEYVSYSTNGVAITTTDVNGIAIDSVAFSTNSVDNPNCSSVSGGTYCTFSIGATSPSTTFNVSAYDAEPVPATGGTATSEPTSANLLSTGTLAGAPITTGQANVVAISLGGVVNSLTFTSASNSYVTGASSVVSAPGTSPSSLTFGYIAEDVDGNMIAAGASDPLANPPGFALTETHANPTAPSSTLTMNGNETPGTSFASPNTSDTFTLAYDGSGTATAASNAYFATITATIPSATDAVSASTVSETGLATLGFAPIFLSATTQPHDVFTAATTSAPASLDYYTPASGGPYTTIGIVSGESIANPAYAANLDTDNGCSGFSFATDPASSALFDGMQSSPVNGSPCDVVFTDGESNLHVNLSVLTGGSGSVTIPNKLQFTPASPFSYTLPGTNERNTDTITATSALGAKANVSIVSCTAAPNTQCLNFGNSFQNGCANSTGEIDVDISGTSGSIQEQSGDYTYFETNPTPTDTGDIVGCVLHMTDGTDTADYSLTLHVSNGAASSSIRRLPSSTKAP